ASVRGQGKRRSLRRRKTLGLSLHHIGADRHAGELVPAIAVRTTHAGDARRGIGQRDSHSGNHCASRILDVTQHRGGFELRVGRQRRQKKHQQSDRQREDAHGGCEPSILSSRNARLLVRRVMPHIYCPRKRWWGPETRFDSPRLFLENSTPLERLSIFKLESSLIRGEAVKQIRATIALT